MTTSLKFGVPRSSVPPEVGTVTSPAVTLSPNARKLVRCSVGTRETVTEKLQVAERESASVAVQLTLVEPSGNDAPEAGVQATVTGVRPPDTVGAGYATCDVVVVVTAETLLGQLIVGAGTTSPPPPLGFDGEVGVSDPPHPAVSAAISRKTYRAAIS